MGSASRIRRAQATKRAGSTGVAGSSTAKQHLKPGVMARVRYEFDNSMSRGPSALIWYLGMVVGLTVVVFAVITLLFGVGPTRNPITATYNALLHMIDTGTVAGDTGTGYIVVQLIVTFLGIFVFSAFIGILATGIDNRLHNLRKGRSLVLEKDHTLILGWSESIFTIISELAVANESERKPSIVVLAHHDKVDMEDEIRARVPNTRGTRVVCRTGDPIVSADLEMVNHRRARSVIVLSPEIEDADAIVVKTILSLTRGAQRRPEPYNVVAEIREAGNLDAAHLAGGDEAVIIDKGLTVSRLIVQTSRQSGAAYVYQELLDFEGDEIYLREDVSLVGRTFGDALTAYENCAVIGLQLADGKVLLNPPMDKEINGGDKLIAVAEDDSVLDVALPMAAEVDSAVFTSTTPAEPGPEATLVLGFNSRVPAVVAELDSFAVAGSRVHVVSADPPDESTFLGAGRSLSRVALTIEAADTTDREVLNRLDIPQFQRVIVMCDETIADAERADARVLIQLLHLREIAKQSGTKFTIVSEILMESDRELASVAQVDDIVVSDQVISYLLAQISENRALADVFSELLQSDGAEVYMRPIEDYVRADGQINFATLVAAARERGETAFGYRAAELANTADASFGVALNVAKSELLDVGPGDKLIVLAER